MPNLLRILILFVLASFLFVYSPIIFANLADFADDRVEAISVDLEEYKGVIHSLYDIETQFSDSSNDEILSKFRLENQSLASKLTEEKVENQTFETMHNEGELEDVKERLKWIKEELVVTKKKFYEVHDLDAFVTKWADYPQFQRENHLNRTREIFYSIKNASNFGVTLRKEKEERLKVERNKNFELKSKLFELLNPIQRQNFTHFKGRNWHGEMVNRWDTNGEKSLKSDRKKERLMVLFVPLPLWKEHTRNLIRATYMLYMPPSADVYFTIGALKDSERIIFDKENQAWGDMLEMPIEEGMNNGKMFYSFKTLYDYFKNNSTNEIQYDFAGKIDDDSFLVFPSMSNLLQNTSRNWTLIGWPRLPGPHIQGRGYLLSWNILKSYCTSKTVKIEGAEDYVVTEWMKANHANWVIYPSFGLYIEGEEGINHGDVLLHRVKNTQYWNDITHQLARDKNRDMMDWLQSKGKIPKPASRDEITTKIVKFP
eukprot:TRINITY_DN2394_c0_g1_i1.p1 TRINITY_DN2394_c0_g1~~TRINITY_DN2394_c0_g1_i1.p1  ORF type:complete len:497 (-),score=110.27 TRINITY_DN2394_c0_g1_i1:10-1464(-)